MLKNDILKTARPVYVYMEVPPRALLKFEKAGGMETNIKRSPTSQIFS